MIVAGDTHHMGAEGAMLLLAGFSRNSQANGPLLDGPLKCSIGDAEGAVIFKTLRQIYRGVC
jgi:hypothetical protein